MLAGHPGEITCIAVSIGKLGKREGLYLMDTEALAKFIVEANRATYAGDGPRCSPVLPGSRQFEFVQGHWLYRDVYFGSNRFQGQSVVYLDSRPVWGLVYSGGVAADRLSPEGEVYPFLKKALCSVTVGEPFRGPRLFAEDRWSYRNEPHGTLEQFTGVEEILFEGRTVYRLHYSGGSIVGQD